MALCLGLIVPLTLMGCGGSTRATQAVAMGGESMADSYGGDYGAAEEMAPSPEAGYAADVVSGGAPVTRSRPIAQAAPPSPPAGAPAQQTGTPTTQPTTATDAIPSASPLLIYTATLHLSVFEVAQNQRSVLEIARELNGFLVQQNNQMVTIRVPAAQFEAALSRIEALGDVLNRNVGAQDVSEEYRDLRIRIRNAELTRQRLEVLLARANAVDDALRVQRELARLTAEVETMRGRLRYLQHRLAFSTLTVHFRPRPTETLSPDIFHLPFPWLDELGLRTLLNLRR